MTTTTSTDADVMELESAVAGRIVLPGHGGWDAARQAFNLAVDQHPAAVVYPAGAEDVAAAVDHARGRGLGVAVQSTGHGAAARGGSLEDAVLLNMAELTAVEIDPGTQTARVEAGTRWDAVADAAAVHGLAGLAGTSTGVGVAGYTLGGGLGWLARRHGLACNSVHAIELVTADGSHRRVDSESDPELFWALRGGGGGFGVVTALELGLHPVGQVYAGGLLWPVERAPEILGWYLDWVESLPDDVTSLGRILHLPPLEAVPEPLRGKSFVGVEAAFLMPEAEATALLRPLRALGPALDSFATTDAPGLADVHGDPRDPVPGAGDHALLEGLTSDAVDVLVATVGSRATTPLVSVELRQLGGAVSIPAPGHGALAALEGDFALYAVGVAATPEQAEVVDGGLRALIGGLERWATGRGFLNFAGRPDESRPLYPASAESRLAAARRQYDPGELFRANHLIAPAG